MFKLLPLYYIYTGLGIALDRLSLFFISFGGRFMSEKYRSVVDLENARDSIDNIWSVCIPSYGRPKAKVFKTLDEYGAELNLHVFVRQEEYKDYKYLEKKGAVVHKLPKYVKNLGQTRIEIVNWAIANKKANIFMLDDDIFDLDILTPQIPVETLMLRAHRFEAGYSKGIQPDMFRYWMYMVKRHPFRDSLVLSGPAARSVYRDKKYIGYVQPPNSRQIIQCMHVNVKLMKQHGINFESNDIVGCEDITFQFRVMEKNLVTQMFSDFMYDVPKVGTGEGGCNEAEEVKDLQERYKVYIERFKKNVLNGKEHKGVKVATNRTGDLPSIKFNWKYWDKMFAEYIDIPF